MRKRIISTICALSLLSAFAIPVYAENDKISAQPAYGYTNDMLIAYGTSSISLGSDIVVATTTDGNAYAYSSSKNLNGENSDFRLELCNGNTVKVKVPKGATYNDGYCIGILENGTLTGADFSGQVGGKNSKIINEVLDWNNIKDFEVTANYVVAITNSGHIKMTSLDRGSATKTLINSEGSSYQVTESAPECEALSWSNVKAISISEDYIAGICTVDGVDRIKIANTNAMTYNTTQDSSGNQSIVWLEQWQNAAIDSAVSNIQRATTVNSDGSMEIYSISATNNFVAYSGSLDGTPFVKTTDINNDYKTKSELNRITDKCTVKAYSDSQKSLVAVLTQEGKVKILETGTSAFMDDEYASQRQEIKEWENIKEIQVNGGYSGYTVVGVTENHKSRIITTGYESDFVNNLNGLNLDTESDPEYSIKHNPTLNHEMVPADKVAYEVDYGDTEPDGVVNGVVENAKKASIDIIKNGYYADNSNTISISKPCKIYMAKYREYYKDGQNYIITQTPYIAAITEKDIMPTVNTSLQTGIAVPNSDGEVSTVLSATFTENEDNSSTSGVVKYVIADTQTSDVIDTVTGKTVSEIQDISESISQIFAEGNIRTSTGNSIEVSLSNSCEIFAWTAYGTDWTDFDGNTHKYMQGPICHFRYTFLTSRPNVYPKQEYNVEYNASEKVDIQKGLGVTKRNSMKAAAGSYMSAVLATNGEVFASRMSNMNIDGMYNATADIYSVPYSESDSSWDSVRMWRMISDIAVGESHVVGLRIDGTVVASGNNDKNQCDVSDWTDIVDVAAGKNHTVGLKKDGTVIGTQVTAGEKEDYGQTSFSTWNNFGNDKEQRIVAIEANNNNTVGLKANGTVAVAGNNDNGQCNTAGWTDIVDIASGTRHTVGLKNDGTVVAVGDNSYGQCNVSDWKNVVQISASAYDTLGITYEGKVLHTGNASYGRVSIYGKSDDIIRIQPTLIDYYLDDNGEYYSQEGDVPIYDSSYYTTEDRINIMSAIRGIENKGVKFKYAAAGNYTFILIDEYGICYNVIHAAGPDNPSDYSYPLINSLQNRSSYIPSLDRGPTIISNYLPGVYDSELPIKLSNTTGEEDSVKWSFDNTDPYAMGSSDISSIINFDGYTVLNVAPFEKIGGAQKNFTEIKYYYILTTPKVSFSPSDKLIQKGGFVSLSCSRPQKYTVYYTTNGDDPYFEWDSDTSSYKPKSSMKQYSGQISLSQTTTIKARAFKNENIELGQANNECSDLYEAQYIVQSDGTGSGTGTTVDTSSIYQDTVWTKSGSPYRVKSNLTVDSGSTLSIEPGVEVICDESVGITINGNLVSYGTTSQHVKFKSSNTELKWSGLSINCQYGNNDSVISNIDVSDALTGIRVSTESTRIKDKTIKGLFIHDNDNGLNIISSELIVQDSTFKDNIGYGINIGAANATIESNQIESNGTGIRINESYANVLGNVITNNECGVFVDGGSAYDSEEVCVNYNEIYGNGLNASSASSSELAKKSFNFKSNYWGTADEAVILQSITAPSESHPTIVISPFLTSNNTESISATAELGGDTEYRNKYITVAVSRDDGIKYKADVITAVYDSDGVLVQTFYEKGFGLPSIGDTTYLDYELSSPTNNELTVRIFVWDSLNGMKPLA